MAFFKLDNIIQNYAWGSTTSINELFGIENSDNLPQAEIWMGAHPGGCSKNAETGELLSDIIEQDKNTILGDYTTERFGELPYLFKVLAAHTPLSIQVHPNKQKSEMGFARENQQGIALNASNRNYKDPNHKPELVYALTFYKAMNGFRPINDIIALFNEVNVTELKHELDALKQSPNSDGLQAFFSAIMTLEGERKQNALTQLAARYSVSAKTAMAREALQYSQEFKAHYDGDIGLFAPLMLNTIELAPGEAMFLFAETPHAYVQGTGLEIMASSDNVLRAGLTPKYIDVPELIDNIIYQPIQPNEIKMLPVNKAGKQSYPIPVDDFGFDILKAKSEQQQQFVRGAEILFCIDGEVTVSTKDKNLTLKPGESAFISNSEQSYQYSGLATLARAFN
ncbi:mannose-6-phosphate isomerase, class I [Vibrio sp. SS-MA-C1-2]|uniref:mannose-6-phosphate isomerase, class I n=1 Tax=Vibrio sp. SS-MA-C1-2 TaxID=2908646 RepID=UPI001F166EEB|nr:mannose-6-phosphate isomerase, class I [Vibrio sp. SS-MA-C1-2]UJF17878.1 mannose-6-phosphate isomerase, class I [Vibrio sp. SS-MA-C1-2]